jgi:hypothetical protein
LEKFKSDLESLKAAIPRNCSIISAENYVVVDSSGMAFKFGMTPEKKVFLVGRGMPHTANRFVKKDALTLAKELNGEAVLWTEAVKAEIAKIESSIAFIETL